MLLLSSAGLLLLVAVLVGLPKGGVQRTPATPNAPGSPASEAAPLVVTASGALGSLTMTGRLSHPVITAGTSEVFATLELTATSGPRHQRAPVNLALVVDRSGSMRGAKIEHARRAAQNLIDLLGAEDRLAVVHYGNDVTTLSGRFATADNKRLMRDFIAGITEEGGTNIGEALSVGQAQLAAAQSDFRVNRLLLLSDGIPTVGITEPRSLVRMAFGLRKTGMSVTALGVGADFNEDLMQALADAGGGSYGFIRDPAVISALFERDLTQAGTIVARAASVAFALPPGVRFVEVYGRPASQEGARVTIGLPDFSADQQEKVVVHLSVTPAATATSVDVGSFELAYHDVLAGQAASGRVTLAAAVTADATLALSRRDKDAVVAATKAQAAANYRRAAVALDEGDFIGAQTVLNQNVALLDEAEGLAGKGAVDEERKANADINRLAAQAPAAPEEVRKTSVKAMKVQSLKSAGRGASAY